MTEQLPQPVSLAGTHITLVPLTVEHVPDLFRAGGSDDEVWRWLRAATPHTEQQLHEIVMVVLGHQENGETCPLAVLDNTTGAAVGWTAYWDIAGFDESVEIGYTWYARSVWRTAINTECKLLMLTHAFDDLGFERVVFKTDNLNTRSQEATTRIGALWEGTMRHHRRRDDGTWRDTLVYSILAEEWPAVRERLKNRLARG